MAKANATYDAIIDDLTGGEGVDILEPNDPTIADIIFDSLVTRGFTPHDAEDEISFIIDYIQRNQK